MRSILWAGLWGVALGAVACTTANESGTADAGTPGPVVVGADASTGGGTGGSVTGSGGTVTNTGGTVTNTGGTVTNTGGTVNNTGGTNTGGTSIELDGGTPLFDDGGTPGFDGGFSGDAGGPQPGNVEVVGDAEIMGMVHAEEAACSTVCTPFDTCNMFDASADPPETLQSCQASCTYADTDLTDLSTAASRDLLVAYLQAATTLDACIAALNCADLGHYMQEDVDPYPCQTEETAYYAASDAAFPGAASGGSFDCADGSDSIPASWVCDMEADCADASDEANCP